MQKLRKLTAVFIILWMIGLIGCGGGGNTTGGNAPAPTGTQLVTGVAATGAPIVGTVYLKDSSSPAREISVPIHSDGSFSLDVTGLTAPFLLKAVGSANGQDYTLCSFANAPGIANINPLSNLAVVQAHGGSDPASLYAATTPNGMQAIKSALATVIPDIQAKLQQVLSQFDVGTTNFVSDPYQADHQGLDLLFDLVTVSIVNGNLTLTNKVGGGTILTATLNGSTLSGQVVTANIPTITTKSAGSVYVYPSSTSVVAGGTLNFKAIVIGSRNQSVVWSVVESGGGNISNAGVYSAPASTGTYHIKATSVDSAQSGTSTIAVGSTGGSWTTLSSGLPASLVTDLAIDPTNSQTIYVGTNDYGIYKSIDGGGTWGAVNSGVSLPNISCLALSTTNSQILFAGADGGVLKSTNGGGSWTVIISGFNMNVWSMAIDPSSDQTVYVGTGARNDGGIFKSVDGGNTWKAMNSGLGNLDISALVIDPTNSQTIYAGTGNGVFKSTNGGSSWSSVNSGLTILNITTLTIDPNNTQTIFAGTWGGGVFKSTSGGGYWNTVNIGITNANIFSLVIAPSNSQIMYVAESSGGAVHGEILRSSNGGASWNAVDNGLPTAPTSAATRLVIDPLHNQIIYAADGPGVFKANLP